MASGPGNKPRPISRFPAHPYPGYTGAGKSAGSPTETPFDPTDGRRPTPRTAKPADAPITPESSPDKSFPNEAE